MWVVENFWTWLFYHVFPITKLLLIGWSLCLLKPKISHESTGTNNLLEVKSSDCDAFEALTVDSGGFSSGELENVGCKTFHRMCDSLSIQSYSFPCVVSLSLPLSVYLSPSVYLSLPWDYTVVVYNFCKHWGGRFCDQMPTFYHVKLKFLFFNRWKKSHSSWTMVTGYSTKTIRWWEPTSHWASGITTSSDGFHSKQRNIAICKKILWYVTNKLFV